MRHGAGSGQPETKTGHERDVQGPELCLTKW